MRRVLAWGVVVALGFGVQGIARAQPQDDAALADEPEKRLGAYPVAAHPLQNGPARPPSRQQNLQ